MPDAHATHAPRSAWLVIALALCVLTRSSPASAGPPYVTDDPEPTDTGRWEDYAFISGAHTPGDTNGQVGIEINYGAAKDLQLSGAVPLDYDHRSGYRVGGGDIEAGVKYRFLHQSQWTPDAAIFPAVDLPTAGRTFGTRHLSLFLPIWLQKDYGKWSVFGGGGYDINPGRDNRNFALVGLALTRSIGKRLNLGVEVYHQTADVAGGQTLTNLGFGAIYQLTRHLALMGSGGPGLQNPRRTGQSAVYASLQLTY